MRRIGLFFIQLVFSALTFSYGSEIVHDLPFEQKAFWGAALFITNMFSAYTVYWLAKREGKREDYEVTDK